MLQGRTFCSLFVLQQGNRYLANGYYTIYLRVHHVLTKAAWLLRVLSFPLPLFRQQRPPTSLLMASDQRAEGRRPSKAPKIEETDSNDKLPRDPEKLAVTSSLHPFWHTKRGCVVIVLVVLVVIGAIVGGAVGGAKAGRQKVNSTTSLASTAITPQTTSQASNRSTSFISGTTFSTTTGSSGIVKATQGT